MNIDDKLSKIFNTDPIPEESTPKSDVTVIDNVSGEIIEASNTKIEADYDIARNNMRNLLQTGSTALETALEIAKTSEHPRAFEVVGNLMKQLADMNQQLIDIHQQKSKLDSSRGSDTTNNTTTNNAIFVGSTAELSKIIKSLK